MRITNSMITNLVTFNMQRSLARFMDMQTQMSSGRRINRPSDDPLGILRDLDYRAELAKNEQYRENIGQAQNWMNSYDSIVANLTSLMSEAKEVTVSMSNSTYDSIARMAAANEVRSIFDQLMQLSRSELEGKQMFSGYRTDQLSLSGSSNGVVYRGDYGIIEFQIEPASNMAINIIGADLFLGQLGILGEEADLDVGVTSTTLLSDLLGGQGVGVPLGTIRITDENLGESVDIDLSGAVTVDDVITTINNALSAHVPPLDNLTVGISEQGNALFLDSTENGLISDVTALDNLNGGSGVDLAAGTFVLTDDAGFVLEIDLTGSSTVGDVINKFNATVAAAPGIDNVTMQLNAAGTGLEIVDTNAAPLGLRVVDISEKSHTAESLGIVGRIDPSLAGRDLNPVTSFSIEEVAGTTAADLGILARFNGDYAGSDLDPALVATALISDLNNGYGFDLGGISLKQGDIQRTIDLSDASIVTIQDLLDAINNSGLDVTATINAAGTGIQVVNDDPTRSFIIQDSGAGRAAKDFQLFGSSDMIGSLMVLEDALRADDQDGVSLMLGTMDAAIQHVLNFRAAVGAKGMRLESTNARLLDMELSFTKLLSEVEDADLTKLVTDLATFENNYQASLIASAKIIQPSLLDFLR